MKRVLFILLFIVLFLASVFQYNNNPAIIISRLPGQAGVNSDELKYRVYLFGLLPVGEAVFERPTEEDYRGKRVYHLHARAGTLKSISKIFKADGSLDSYIETQEFNPVLFKQRLSLSGKPDVIKEVYYEQGKGIMSILGVERQILKGTQDPLSAIFNIRRMDFSKQREFEFNLNTNQKNYILKGTSLPRDFSAHGETYKTAVLTADIRRRNKNPYHNSNIAMVLLRERENAPVLIKVFAGGFFMSARLIEVK